MTATYMTESGVRRLRQKLSTKLAEHASLCEERKTAHELSGDGWHDNPYFDRLQQLEAEKTREIVALKHQLDNARVVSVDPNRRPLNKVQIGSIVALRIEDESGHEQTATWEITGFGETDVSSHQLGYNTPLAQAVLNEPVGSEVLANLPGGSVLITVVALLEGW